MKNEIKEIISDGFKSAFGGIIANEGIDHASGIIATALHKKGYRKQSETVKEFAEKVKFGMAQFGYYHCGSNGVEYFGDIQVNDFTKMIDNLVEQYGKEECNE